RWRAPAFRKDLAHAVPGGLGCNHRDVYGLWRLDGAKPYVEAVREHERLARLQIRLDGLAIELRLLRVRRKHHDDFRPGRCFGGSIDRPPFLFGVRARGAGFRQAAGARDPAIPRVHRIRVALEAVAYSAEYFPFYHG